MALKVFLIGLATAKGYTSSQALAAALRPTAIQQKEQGRFTRPQSPGSSQSQLCQQGPVSNVVRKDTGPATAPAFSSPPGHSYSAGNLATRSQSAPMWAHPLCHTMEVQLHQHRLLKLFLPSSSLAWWRTNGTQGLPSVLLSSG